MTTRPETSYEKNVIQFKTLWSLAVHKGIEEWLDRLIANAQEMRRIFSKATALNGGLTRSCSILRGPSRILKRRYRTG